MNLIELAIVNYWGERCETHTEACLVCKVWAEYDVYKDAIRWKEALEAGGVDNWDWYSESLHRAGYFDDSGEGY